MKRLILTILLLSTLNLLGQKVTIKGQIPFSSESESSNSITLLKPINGTTNSFYSENATEIQIKDWKFNIEIDIEKAGFVVLNSKIINNLYFYVEPNDTIIIQFVENDSTGKTKAIFSGNNSSANNLLSDRLLFNNGPISFSQFKVFFDNADSEDELYVKINTEITSKNQILNKLFEDKKISKGCLNSLLIQIQQYALFWCNMFNNKKTAIDSKLSSDEIQKLIRKMNTIYDPFKSENRIATTNYSNCHRKSIFMMNNIIETGAPTKSIWSKYDKAFGIVAEQIGSMDYAPVHVQEYFIGYSLLISIAYKSMNDEVFYEIFQTFEKQFPKSIYISIIKKYLNSKIRNDNNIVFENRYNMFLKDRFSNVKECSNFERIDTVSTVQSLIKNNFQGRKVFIDFWATWCSPCISEFKYEKELHDYLAKNDIEILYISVDDTKAKGIWEKMINKYQINGYHYIVNPEVAANLSKWFEGIPRYMLFDSDGKMINDNLLRPSEKQKLYSQIQSLIGR